MLNSGSDARYLTFLTLDTLWGAGAPLAVTILGSPSCRLLFDPASSRMTLVTVYESPEPDVSKLLNVSFQASANGDNELAEITVRVDGNVHAAYSLLATIADELQMGNSSLAAAVATGVARHRNLVAPRAGLTTETEVGLFGEILLLEYMIGAVGAGPAVASWQGPLSEEHDFALGPIHLEVKTTVGERRRHRISGLSQLVPLRGIPLSLISIQLTRSAPENGRSLPSLISAVRATVGGHVVAVDQRLDAIGWSAEDTDLYPTVWTLRTRPRAYDVSGDFPRMTSELLSPVVPTFALVSDVSYRVDLTDRAHSSLPDPMAGFVELKEN